MEGCDGPFDFESNLIPLVDKMEYSVQPALAPWVSRQAVDVSIDSQL